MYTLRSYWRSSSSWRVRIALTYKGIAHTIVPVNLIAEGGGEQKNAAHVAKNPMAQVPVLELDGVMLSQSLAIIEYLEEAHPEPALLPKDALRRAQARQVAEVVNSGIQPLQNPSITERVVAVGGDAKAWAQHFNVVGLTALEAMVRPLAGRFCVGDAVSVADLCLVPQLYSARRFSVPLEPYPTLVAIEARCLALAAFSETHPDRHKTVS